jgi:anti-sigma factor RsiW
MNDPVTEKDLALYIDGQIDPTRRLAVERHLAGNPSLAAEVIDELRINHELRMSMADLDSAPQPGSSELARRLQGALGRRIWFERLRPTLAAFSLVVIGAFAGNLATTALTKPPVLPEYVEAALRAHEVSMVRAIMVSQPEAPEYDRAELLSATAIVMPALPEDWDVRDVQVYPSRFGPSVEMVLHSPDLDSISIFAARPGDFDVHQPSVVSHAGSALAYWQIGEIAYAIVGSASEPEILKAAQTLADTLY